MVSRRPHLPSTRNPKTPLLSGVATVGSRKRHSKRDYERVYVRHLFAKCLDAARAASYSVAACQHRRRVPGCDLRRDVVDGQPLTTGRISLGVVDSFHSRPSVVESKWPHILRGEWREY